MKPRQSVYFSYHYQDICKVEQIRKAGVLFGDRTAGVEDASLFEEEEEKDRKALQKAIVRALVGSSVTVVLIGAKTAWRYWVRYEIEQSIRQGNALFGLHINKLPDRDGRTTRRGHVPSALRKHGCPIYAWSGVRDFTEKVSAAWATQRERARR